MDPAKDDRRNTERMAFRTKPHIKSAIQRAAAISGMDDSAFTMNAAYREAIETIERHERTRLVAADHAVFFKALGTPPPARDRLLEAADRHRKTIVPR